ncbi:MAG TPA: DUF192 domain-containing protein [Candidatus Lustribacter sp.]|jgi:hypothetical protein|nr:DUF192 domain-containing protein [Candidatus Lustribacter sp.]
MKFALATVLALALAPAAVAAQPTPAGCVTSQTASAVPVRVRAPAETLDLRVADTPSKREYGLMCVRSLPPGTGMIFVFGDGDNYRDFWMKNTLIPLDMVFVAKNGRVNEVRANVPATTVDTPDQRIPHRDGTGSYVIELSAGEAARAGIKHGAVLDVSAVSNLNPPD